jgi:Cft2 family RNA processing exonuclease
MGARKEWIGYAQLKHTLPAEHLTIECGMVEQKKEYPHRPYADGGKL